VLATLNLALINGKRKGIAVTEIRVLHEGPIVKRSDAKDQGLKRYFTGESCPHGHISERFTSNGRCISCAYIQRDDFRLRNPDYERGRYKTNRDKILKANKNWAKNNPINGRIRAMRYYARKMKSEGYHTSKDIEEILNRQKLKCANCGVSIDSYYEVDHIMPLYLGGSNWPNNLQCLCRSCNARKHAKHPIDWALENGRLC